jgi:hypothetical protein
MPRRKEFDVAKERRDAKKKARAEYDAHARERDENTARLRALRLAKEDGGRAAGSAAPRPRRYGATGRAERLMAGTQ